MLWEVTVTLTFDFWLPKSNLLIPHSKWMFSQYVKWFSQGVPQMSRSQGKHWRPENIVSPGGMKEFNVEAERVEWKMLLRLTQTNSGRKSTQKHNNKTSIFLLPLNVMLVDIYLWYIVPGQKLTLLVNTFSEVSTSSRLSFLFLKPTQTSVLYAESIIIPLLRIVFYCSSYKRKSSLVINVEWNSSCKINCLFSRVCQVPHLQQSNSGTHINSIPSAPAAEPISRDTVWKPGKSKKQIRQKAKKDTKTASCRSLYLAEFHWRTRWRPDYQSPESWWWGRVERARPCPDGTEWWRSSCQNPPG